MARGRPRKHPIKEATKKQIRDRLHYINESAEPPLDASKLSFDERRLLVTLADPLQQAEKRTIGQVCEAAGISYGAYRRAMDNPEFTVAVNALVQATLRQAILPLVRAGVKFAMEGSYRHWDALLRMGGQIEQDGQGDDKEIVIRFAGAAAPVVIDAEIVHSEYDNTDQADQPSNDAETSV